MNSCFHSIEFNLYPESRKMSMGISPYELHCSRLKKRTGSSEMKLFLSLECLEEAVNQSAGTGGPERNRGHEINSSCRYM